ncbi:hypothetical protein HanIR_Chr09g0425881 [Helianthus annuus]|nr:hypothetical protein HanIR_Chr09g0425881 [Helianthus annuus]
MDIGTHLDEVPPPPGIDPRAPPKVQPTPAFDRLVVDPLAHPCGKTALARDRTRDQRVKPSHLHPAELGFIGI